MVGASQRPGTLTHHGEGPDAGLHRALVLLLQPRTLEQPRSGLQQLHHDRLVCLREATVAAAWPALHPGQPAQGPEPAEKGMGGAAGSNSYHVLCASWKKVPLSVPNPPTAHGSPGRAPKIQVWGVQLYC